MSSKKKHRPTIAAGRRTIERFEMGKTASCSHLTQRNAAGQPQVFNLLSLGEENAVSAAQLSNILGIPARSVTKEIRAERLKGYPIAASGHGFFVPRTREEAAKFARRLHHRAGAIHAAATAIERAVCDPPEQTFITEG